MPNVSRRSAASCPHRRIAQDAGHLLALLADSGRIRLPTALTAAGELCVRDLAPVVGRNLLQLPIAHVTHPPRSSADV